MPHLRRAKSQTGALGEVVLIGKREMTRWTAKLERLETSRHWIAAGGLGSLLLLAQPVFCALHFFWNLMMGAYPPEADSITIPIYHGVIAWMLVAPIGFCCLWWAIWKCPGGFPIFGWNRRRPIWSTLWTTVFFFLVFVCLVEIPYHLRWVNLPSLINAVAWAIVFIYLRAAVTFKKFLVT